MRSTCGQSRRTFAYQAIHLIRSFHHLQVITLGTDKHNIFQARSAIRAHAVGSFSSFRHLNDSCLFELLRLAAGRANKQAHCLVQELVFLLSMPRIGRVHHQRLCCTRTCLMVPTIASVHLHLANLSAIGKHLEDMRFAGVTNPLGCTYSETVEHPTMPWQHHWIRCTCSWLTDLQYISVLHLWVPCLLVMEEVASETTVVHCSVHKLPPDMRRLHLILSEVTF